MGYYNAGFDVVGVDIVPQPRYPFPFQQGDAIEFLIEALDSNSLEVEAIHASPPCQRYSTMTKRWGREEEHPDLVLLVRDLLVEAGLPYIIENVPGAPLIEPTLLCGSMFNLKVRRHRMFETNFAVPQPNCRHDLQGKVVGVYGHAGGSSKRDGITFSGTASWREAMGIAWMTGKELAEALPPAYTEYIGTQLLNR